MRGRSVLLPIDFALPSVCRRYAKGLASQEELQTAWDQSFRF